MPPSPRPAARFYLPALEGLRFVAFLLVFLQHLPRAEFLPMLKVLQDKGSVGVDIFFALSAFLLTALVALERRDQGRCDFGAYMLRRGLRIMPLLYAYSIAAFLWAPPGGESRLRLAGQLLFADNIVTWFRGYSETPFTAHLWTLSYEMQFYPLIPLLALVAARRPKVFAALIAALLLTALAGRAAAAALGLEHPIIWVTPFLRPESMLAGVVLAQLYAAGRLKDPRASLLAGLGTAAVLAAYVLLPTPYDGWASIGSYLVIGLVGAAALACALTLRPLAAVLAWSPIAFLGKISYGLYVLHTLAIGIVAGALHAVDLDTATDPLAFALHFSAALLLTIALASLSWFLLERPFLRLKLRFEAVHSRPV